VSDDAARKSEAEWDAEIEADFQRVKAATRAVGKRKQRQKMMGAPLDFWADVCRLTEGRVTLVVAMYIYRRTCVCGNQTVTLPAGELAELGIDRRRKGEALAKLQAARLIQIRKVPTGRAAEVRLTWRPR